MGAFGTVAAQLGTDIANERDKRRADAADARTAAINERALALRQMLEQQRASDEHAQAGRQAEAFLLEQRKREQEIDFARKEYQLRWATAQNAGYTDKMFGRDKKTGIPYVIFTGPNKDPLKQALDPNFESEAEILRDKADKERNVETKEFDGYEWQREPDMTIRGTKAHPRGGPSNQWIRMGKAKQAAGGVMPDLDALAADVATGRASMPTGRYGAMLATRMKQLGMEPPKLGGRQAELHAQNLLTRYRALSESVARAKFSPGLWASILQGAGVKSPDEMEQVLSDMKDDVRAAYLRAGLELPANFDSIGGSSTAEDIGTIPGAHK